MTDARQSEPVDTVIAQTREWIEKAVIGLDLCPFAKSVYAGSRIRYSLSEARDAHALLADLEHELRLLHGADAKVIETTLLVHPHALTDFIEYNEFLNVADAALAALGLKGELQVASFHPRYQFADTQPDDIENYTNRSPYPMLHLLRESSVERALSVVADPAEIYERNIVTLQRLGHDGWRRLWSEKSRDE